MFHITEEKKLLNGIHAMDAHTNTEMGLSTLMDTYDNYCSVTWEGHIKATILS